MHDRKTQVGLGEGTGQGAAVRNTVTPAVLRSDKVELELTMVERRWPRRGGAGIFVNPSLAVAPTPLATKPMEFAAEDV